MLSFVSHRPSASTLATSPPLTPSSPAALLDLVSVKRRVFEVAFDLAATVLRVGSTVVDTR